MGVHGLWHLLQPTGRPVSLQSLEGKVLAVDVSIWLHQAVKGMRNKDGSPMHNAHLHVLFTRVCKLLYYKIKPVFVFDGSVPELKKQTMASRREKKMMAEVEGDKASKKILDNLLKSHALKEVMKKGHASTDSSSSMSQSSTSSQSQDSIQKPDLFQLPPLPEEFARAQEIQPWEEPTSNATIFEDEYQNLDDIDIDSAGFKSLPAEVQHEILSEIKERRKRLTRYSNLQLPKDSNDFSSFQMAKLLKQNHLSNKIEEVRMEMTKQISGEITQDLGEHAVGTEIQAQKILSDDSSHFILIKGLSNKRKMEELDRIKEEAEREEELEKESPIKGERIVEDDKVMIDLGESDSEICDSNQENNHSEDKGKNMESQISRFTDDEPIEQSISCSSKSDKPFVDSYHEKEDVIFEGSNHFNRDQERNGEHVKYDGEIEINATSSDVSKRKNGNSKDNDKTETIQSASREANLGDDNTCSKAYEIQEKTEKGSVNPLPQNVERKSSNHIESSDSEDEGFIEVSIDPTKIGPDELFPADIFTTTSTKGEEIPVISASNTEEQLSEEPRGSAEREHSPEPEYTQLIEPEPTSPEISSESPNDLVKQFTELVENDVDRVYEDLEVETRAL